MQKYLLIAFGGALGSMARVWVGGTVMERMGGKFPFGTFAVNLTACFLIGFTMAFLNRHVELSPEWKYLLPVGFVGAYSTFSTFEWEALSNLQAGAFFIASSYVVLSIFLGLAAVWVGIAFAKAVS